MGGDWPWFVWLMPAILFSPEVRQWAVENALLAEGLALHVRSFDDG
ncbi:hypothetical protein DEU38_11046 [Rhodococcus sp. AG1013]|nr:hypothetical protein DEU38_11046 [Rhodococcus sp. AG1013]